MKTILVTGSNRGIGLEFVKQLSKQNRIFATCRLPEEAFELQEFARNNQNITVYPLDITSDKQILDLANTLKDSAIDWLINNAGIAGQSGVTIGNIERENFLHVMNVNCLSPLKISEAFLPLLLKGNDKLIVTISSSMGSISNNLNGRSYAYRASKCALNCVMRSFAIDVKDAVNVMLLNPGWVKTRLGGAEAELDVVKSVSSLLKIIEKYKRQSHAEVLFNYNGEEIAW